MAARVVSVAFDGVEARRVEVEVQVVGGLAAFVVVGLADKAVGEARERVRAAFAGLGLALPHERVVANLAPADLPKEGNHFDLPIALAVMAAMGIIPQDALDGWAAIGELNLNGEHRSSGGSPAGRHGRQRHGPRPDLSGGLRARSGLGGRDAHPRAPLAHRPRQPFPRQSGAWPAATGADAGGRRASRSARRQGPGERQAGSGDRRRGRPQPALHRARRERENPCSPSACREFCRRSRRPNCWKPPWFTASPD